MIQLFVLLFWGHLWLPNKFVRSIPKIYINLHSMVYIVLIDSLIDV